MCIAGILLNVHPDVPLLLFHNRDETAERAFHTASFGASPTNGLVCALDTECGGTWMGANPSAGRVAMLTNVRGGTIVGATSRGVLVTGALLGDLNTTLQGSYRGFNLVVAETHGGRVRMEYATNGPVGEGLGHREVSDGVHTLCNSFLDDMSWPKTSHLQRRSEDVLRPMLMASVMSVPQLVSAAAGLLCETPGFTKEQIPNPTGCENEPFFQRDIYTFADVPSGGHFQTCCQSVVVVYRESSSSSFALAYWYRRTHTPTHHDEWTTVTMPL